MLEGLFDNWRKRREARRDWRRLSDNERMLLARDIGVPQDMLERVLAGETQTEQLGKMLEAVGLNPNALRRRYPDVFVDMIVVCSQCDVARACRRSLARGDAAARHQEFCPNSPTIESLAHDAAGAKPIISAARASVH